MEKLKTILISITVGLFICLGWMALVGTLFDKLFEVIPIRRLGFIGSCLEALIMLTALLLPLIILILVKGFKKRCSACKKLFAMREEETVVLSRKPKYVKVINNTYSKYTGEVTHESEQRILGTQKTLRTRYVCKYCNAERHKTFYRDTDEPWKE